jgi:hypothetical protein
MICIKAKVRKAEDVMAGDEVKLKVVFAKLVL